MSSWLCCISRNIISQLIEILHSKLLKFSKPTVNALDSVSDRDFAVEFLFVLSLISIHLSRMAEEIILWSNQQFNFIKLAR